MSLTNSVSNYAVMDTIHVMTIVVDGRIVIVRFVIALIVNATNFVEKKKKNVKVELTIIV